MTERELSDLVAASNLVQWLIERPGAAPKIRATWAATASEYLARVAESERKEAARPTPA